MHKKLQQHMGTFYDEFMYKYQVWSRFIKVEAIILTFAYVPKNGFHMGSWMLTRIIHQKYHSIYFCWILIDL